MLLTIDVGNSNIVIGIYNNNTLLNTFRLETNLNKTEDEFASTIIACFEVFNLDYKKVDGVIISSVILAINPILEKMATKYFNSKVIFVGPNLKSGIAIKIDQPKTLGPDLLAGVVGAKIKFGLNCLVIDLGTATTMSILNENSEFIGGVVLPGLKTSVNSLTSGASNLPYINLEIPKQVICKDTITCMQSGLLYGYASMIDGLINKMQKEYVQKLTIILTGGLSEVIIELLENEVIHDENLVLDGLNHLYYKNKK